METKVKVYGKAQNRIALGIINAYMEIHPEADLNELTKAFPDGINPDCGSKQLFMTEDDINEHVENGEEWYASPRGYFVKKNEWLIMPDGERVGFVSMWSKPSLERLVEQAAEYGIEVVESDEKRGTYRLEYLNGFKPTKQKETTSDDDAVSSFVGEVQQLMEEYGIDYVPLLEASKWDEWDEDDFVKVESYDDMLDVTYGDSVDELLDDDGKEQMEDLLCRIPDEIFPTAEQLNANEKYADWGGLALLITPNGIEYEER